MEEEMLQIRLAKYDELIETLHREREVSKNLRRELKGLRELVDKWKSIEGVKVLEILEIVTEDAQGDLKGTTRHYSVKGFDEVRGLVEERYGVKIEDLERSVERFSKRAAERRDECSELQCEVDRLKRRSLWQRILNR